MCVRVIELKQILSKKVKKTGITHVKLTCGAEISNLVYKYEQNPTIYMWLSY